MLVEVEFGDAGFCGGKKTVQHGEKPMEQAKNQQQTQPIYGNGPELNTGHFEGRGERGESALTTVPSLLPNDNDHS